jgi:hypothetical protein
MEANNSTTIRIKSFAFLLFFTLISNAQVGIGTTNPDDELDVIGNTQVSGYLRVGNPAVPQTVTNTGMLLYSMGGADFYAGFTQNGCGQIWQATNTGTTDTDTGVISYDNAGGFGHQNLVSPHIWVPSNVSMITVEISHFCTLEDGFDGVYLEYSTDNGASWNGIAPADFILGGYVSITDGSNTTCTAILGTDAWTGNLNNFITALTMNMSNTWVQFRFVGMEDGSISSGVYELLNFTVMSDTFTSGSGGAFASGNIYSEKNIYAGSNVLLGDLAEYFPVVGKAEKGDIISFVNGKRDLYSVSTKTNDKNIIGVYSSNPTVTLNNPNSGVPIALQGRVPVNVTREPFKKGDYLTSSNVPGKAMKATTSSFVIGRALEDYNADKKQVICLVNSGWKNINSSSNHSSYDAIMSKERKDLIIFNDAIKENSKLFLTFKGNIGSRYWIENIKNGSFELHLEKNAITDVSFDYLIDNAKLNIASNEPNASIVKKSKPKKQQITSSETPHFATSSLIEYSETQQIPPTVPDVTKAYVWSVSNGLKESK